jgi:creatinine amidohydrolase
MSAKRRLSDLSTDALAELLASFSPVVALVPVGSTEPHGPHLPLSTDLLISEGACDLAAEVLEKDGRAALVAPGIPYGVTDYAAGFSGAISIPRDVLVAYLRAISDSLLSAGFSHVCLVNNHLEPAHDEAVRASIAHLGNRASVACPLTRRWARTLTQEFKSGACHAGQYETSLVEAVAPHLVNRDAANALPDLGISLSDGIKRGLATFRAMGIERAYTGSPRSASAEEGRRTLELLATMIVTEVTEAMTASAGPVPEN